MTAATRQRSRRPRRGDPLRRVCSVCRRLRVVAAFWWPNGAGPDFLTLCLPCDRAFGRLP